MDRSKIVLTRRADSQRVVVRLTISSVVLDLKVQLKPNPRMRSRLKTQHKRHVISLFKPRRLEPGWDSINRETPHSDHFIGNKRNVSLKTQLKDVTTGVTRACRPVSPVDLVVGVHSRYLLNVVGRGTHRFSTSGFQAVC